MDLVASPSTFENYNIKHIRIDGRLSSLRRQKNMELFSSEKDTPILLMNTGVGAFGQIFILDSVATSIAGLPYL